MPKIQGAVFVIMILVITNLHADVEQAPVRFSIINESESGNGSERDCIVVYPDSNYHLERRHQSPSADFADLVVFESRLTPDDLKVLEGDLLQLSRSGVPEYEPPAIPFGLSTFQSMIVKLTLDGIGHTFGYVAWPPDKDTSSPNNSPETKLNWQRSAAALRPLYGWTEELIQRNAKSSNIDRSAANLCGEL